ncbi:MAG: helix-turn-helix domain-containing protein [Acidimicrobiales bacterium]
MATRRSRPISKPLLSVEEASVLLGETRSTMYRAVKAGTLPLPVILIGSRIRIPRAAVERLIEGIPSGQGSEPPQEADGKQPVARALDEGGELSRCELFCASVTQQPAHVLSCPVVLSAHCIGVVTSHLDG